MHGEGGLHDVITGVLIGHYGTCHFISWHAIDSINDISLLKSCREELRYGKVSSVGYGIYRLEYGSVLVYESVRIRVKVGVRVQARLCSVRG